MRDIGLIGEIDSRELGKVLTAYVGVHLNDTTKKIRIRLKLSQKHLQKVMVLMLINNVKLKHYAILVYDIKSQRKIVEMN